MEIFPAMPNSCIPRELKVLQRRYVGLVLPNETPDSYCMLRNVVFLLSSLSKALC